MGGVFISYRRDDTAGYAGRLYDALTAHFGRDLVFIDVDSIRAGENFVDVIDKWIASSSVVIVLIGKAWLNSAGSHARRLDDPHDFVRLEVASALRQKIPVIPVLVGGAKMPPPDDLPAPLAPLAQINAIEIFDQLFRDSVRHLIDALRPHVYPKPLSWPWSRPVPSRLKLWIFAAVLLVVVGVAGVILSLKGSPDHNDHNDTGEVAPDPSETLAGPDESGARSTPVKVTTPSDVTELPPVVEASKKVMLPGSSSQVTGPVKPRILWRANVTVGDAWHVVGIAADGTVYLYDEEHNILDAIRDGKEQWAHPTPGPSGFDAEGRLWLGDYCFNSRGEGGHVKTRSLLAARTTLQLAAASHQDRYVCSQGKVFVNSRSKNSWSVDLDGNCGSQAPTIAPQTGNIYASSDARTLYAITPNGQVLWSVKQACKDSRFNVYPSSNDDLIVACSNQPLYSLRGGKPLWTATLGASGGWSWSNIVSDGSGSIYLGGEGPSIANQLIALDKSGKQIWKVSAGATYVPQPAGFDAQGRLYVTVSERIVSLSQ
jgi:TIR domain-containing protein